MKKYRVTVTRTETFEILETSPDRAVDLAFEETWFVETKNRNPKVLDHDSLTEDHTVERI